MNKPKTEQEMLAITNEWAELKDCDDAKDMRYFSNEILSIIQFIEAK
jgi:hypothetical protein